MEKCGHFECVKNITNVYTIGFWIATNSTITEAMVMGFLAYKCHLTVVEKQE